MLTNQLGLSFGTIGQLLRDRFGLTLTRGGLVPAVHRAARQAPPTQEARCATGRGSPVVTPEEPGWNGGGLFDPTLDAPNWRAEDAVPPAGVTRTLSPRSCGRPPPSSPPPFSRARTQRTDA